MKPIFILLHQTYTTVGIALFRGTGLLNAHELRHHDANALLIPTLNELLCKQNLTLKDITFIASTTGPGPFTTVRTVVVTANGLGFATGLPLIGIPLHEAAVRAAAGEPYSHVIGLYHAFCQDIYVTVYETNTQQMQTTVMPLEECLAYLHQLQPRQPCYLGNAIAIHENRFSPAGIGTTLPEFPSLETLAHEALRAWHEERTVLALVPFYGKPYTLSTVR